MTLENRLKVVLISFAVWSVLSLEGGEGTGSGGDKTRFRRRRDNHDGYHADSNVTTCNCTSHSSRLTCKTPTPGCEQDEVRHNDSCYRFVTQGDSRNDSVRDCIQRNSHLVYIETNEEQRFLAHNLAGNYFLRRRDYWLGLVAVNVTYIWMNGDTVAQGLFDVDDEGGNCVFLTQDEGSVTFKTGDCSVDKSFICESTDPGCVPVSCYAFSKGNRRRTRDEASVICRDWVAVGWEEGQLLYIETSRDLNYSTRIPNGQYWIGLNVTRTYQWMDGTPALFHSFESSNGDNGNECFRMRRDKFKWNDFQCHQQLGHICERRTFISVTQQEGDQCHPSIPNDLIRLSECGALCFDLHDTSSTPTLRRCDTHENVEECSCLRETTGQIQCSCGFCKFESILPPGSDGSVCLGEVWPSDFSCSCSSSIEETEIFTIMKRNGTAFDCSPDGLPSTTSVSQVTTGIPSVPTNKPKTDGGTLPPSTTGQPISSHGTSPVVTAYAGSITATSTATSTAPSTRPVSSSATEENGTTASVTSNGGAVAAGVILAIVFFAGLLVVAFFVWRRKGRKRSEKKSMRSDKSRAAKNPGSSGQPETDNPTYGLGELDISEQSGRILKPIHDVGVHAARNPTYDIGDERETSNGYTHKKSPDNKRMGDNTYTDIQPRGYEAYRPNHQPDPYTALKGTKDGNEDDDPATYTPIPDNAGESYATIASSGYTAYNPTKQDDDVYTDPLSTRDTDDDNRPVYTPIPNSDRGKPAKKVVDDVDDDEYVGLDYVVPQRSAAAAAARTTPSAADRSGDSDYVDVDAKEPRVLKPTVPPKKKDDNSTAEDDYYFKLENPNAPPDEVTEARNTPQEDHTYNSLDVNARKIAPGQSNADIPDNNTYNNTYNTVDRTHRRQAVPKSAGQSPAQANIPGKGNVKDNNAYDVINRTGGGVKYPIVAADDGDYSLTVPPRDDTYNSFDRSHGRNKKSRPTDQTSQNDYGSLENNDDGEYATFNKI